ISSATTIGTRADGKPSDEDTPPDPGWERNGYRASKVRAELVIQGWSEGDGVRVPVIVPAWMWGPGDAAPGASGRVFLAVARRDLPAPGPDHRRRSQLVPRPRHAACRPGAPESRRQHTVTATRAPRRQRRKSRQVLPQPRERRGTAGSPGGRGVPRPGETTGAG